MANIFLQGAQPAMGFETLTVTNAVKTLTSTVYQPFESTNNTTKQAKLALITVETNSIRFTLDGTTPSASVGHVVPAGSSLELQSISQIRQVQMFRVTSDATIQVTYFGS